MIVLGPRPSGYNGAGGFNKSQSLQNLSRPRRGEPEKVPIEHLFEKERLIEQQTATIEASLLQTSNLILFTFFDICCITLLKNALPQKLWEMLKLAIQKHLLADLEYVVQRIKQGLCNPCFFLFNCNQS